MISEERFPIELFIGVSICVSDGGFAGFRDFEFFLGGRFSEGGFTGLRVSRRCFPVGAEDAGFHGGGFCGGGFCGFRGFGVSIGVSLSVPRLQVFGGGFSRREVFQGGGFQERSFRGGRGFRGSGRRPRFSIGISGGGFTVTDFAGFEVYRFSGRRVFAVRFSWAGFPREGFDGEGFPVAGFRGQVSGGNVLRSFGFFEVSRFSGGPTRQETTIELPPTTTMIQRRCPARSTYPCSAFSPPVADSLSRYMVTPMTRPS